MTLWTTLMAGALVAATLEPQRGAATSKSDPHTIRVQACRLSDVLGLEVLDAQEQEIALLTDVLIRNRDGHVLYAVLSRGGLGEMGADRYVVPFDRFELRTREDGKSDPRWEADMSAAELEACPRYEEEAEFDGEWAREVSARFEGSERKSEVEEDADGCALVCSSTLEGQAVEGARDDRLGAIDEIVVAVNARRVVYCVLGAGGTPRLGEQHVAVRFESLTITPRPGDRYERVDVSLPVGEHRLDEVPAYDLSDWERVQVPLRLDEVSIFYDVEFDRASTGSGSEGTHDEDSDS